MLTSKKYADALNSLKEQIGLNKNTSEKDLLPIIITIGSMSYFSSTT